MADAKTGATISKPLKGGGHVAAKKGVTYTKPLKGDSRATKTAQPASSSARRRQPRPRRIIARERIVYVVSKPSVVVKNPGRRNPAAMFFWAALGMKVYSAGTVRAIVRTVLAPEGEAKKGVDNSACVKKAGKWLVYTGGAIVFHTLLTAFFTAIDHDAGFAYALLILTLMFLSEMHDIIVVTEDILDLVGV